MNITVGKAAIAGHSKGEREHHRLVFVYELFEVRLPITGHTRCYSLIRKRRTAGMQRVTFLREKSSARSLKEPGNSAKAAKSGHVKGTGFRSEGYRLQE